MFTLITVFFSISVVALTGWTITTYLVNEDSQKAIKKELKNLQDKVNPLTKEDKNLKDNPVETLTPKKEDHANS